MSTHTRRARTCTITSPVICSPSQIAQMDRKAGASRPVPACVGIKVTAGRCVAPGLGLGAEERSGATGAAGLMPQPTGHCENTAMFAPFRSKESSRAVAISTFVLCVTSPDIELQSNYVASNIEGR